MENITRVDRHHYPAIFTGCIVMLTDNGCLHREAKESDPTFIVALLPAHPASGFGRMEAAVAGLDEKQFAAFFYGEDTEATAVALTDIDLANLNVILNQWFDMGMPIESNRTQGNTNET